MNEEESIEHIVRQYVGNGVWDYKTFEEQYAKQEYATQPPYAQTIYSVEQVEQKYH
jgi:hypothetical protein